MEPAPTPRGCKRGTGRGESGAAPAGPEAAPCIPERRLLPLLKLQPVPSSLGSDCGGGGQQTCPPGRVCRQPMGLNSLTRGHL